MREFDRYATGYKGILDQSLGQCGGTAEYFADYKARYAARFAGHGFTGTVLDFGCGIGLVSRSLKQYLPSATVHGYDESPASIAMVDPLLRHQGLFTSERRELKMDYDLIVIANVLHHVPLAGRQQIFNEVVERLVLGGRLLVFEHNPVNPLTQWVVRHCPLDQGAILLWSWECRAYMRRAGLYSVNRRYIMFFPRPFWLVPRIESWLGWCPFGAQYAIEGQKKGQGSPHDIIR